MIELLLKKGDQIYDFNFPSAVKGGDPGMSSEGFSDATFRIKRIEKKRHGLFWATTTTTTTDQSIAFKWLPWVDGKINYCPAQGNDILSGFFSGCWMARYLEDDWRICHIALQDNPKDCKEAWRAKKTTMSEVTEFRPHSGMDSEKILGLITGAGAFYAIGLNAINNLYIANPWKTAEKWKEKVPILSDIQAAECAAKVEVHFSNIYQGLAYRVVKIKGPIAPQSFPE